MTPMFFGARAQLVTSFEPGQPPQSATSVRQALAAWADLAEPVRTKAVLMVSAADGESATRVLGSAEIADLMATLQRA